MSQRRQASGRPRDPGVERRALAAARLIYGEYGKAQVTFNNVAARAGVGKPALYRRWHGPEQLLMEALRRIPLPMARDDLGDLQADLAAYAQELMQLYVSPDGAAWLRLAMEFHDESEPFRKLMSELAGGMIGFVSAMIERAVSRGETAPGLSAETIVELITGGILSHTVLRLRASEIPPEDQGAEYYWRLAGLALGRAEGPAPASLRRWEPEPELPPPGSRRAELIRIAQQVVADRGFADLTLAAVAESAGVTTPALYTHFSSRADLLEQVLEITSREYVDDLRRTDDPDAAVEERLRTRLRRWATVPTARLRVLHDAVLHIPDSPKIKMAAQRASAAWNDFVRDVLDRGMARNEVRPDVDVDAATQLLTSSLLGVEVATETGLADTSLLDLTDQLVDMFVAYLGVPNRSTRSVDGRVGSDLRSP